MLGTLAKYFNRQITIVRWKFNLYGVILAVVGLSTGLYLASIGFIGHIKASGDVSYDWDFAVAGDYTLSDPAAIEVSGSSARLKVQEYVSDDNTALLLHLNDNATDDSSHAQTTQALAVTYDSGKLQNGADFGVGGAQIIVDNDAALNFTGQHTLEAWVKPDTNYTATTQYQRLGIIDRGEYQLYLDPDTGTANYELSTESGATPYGWTQRGGANTVTSNGINNSWDQNGKSTVESSVYANSRLYVGLGQQNSDSEVWEYDGSNWTQIGGDGLRSSWLEGTSQVVSAMVATADHLYIGLGNAANSAEVWRYSFSGQTWVRVGGKGVNSSWSSRSIVNTLAVSGTTVYAGLGSGNNQAEVWRCTSCNSDSPTWGGAVIGGVGVNASWNNNNYQNVFSLVVAGDYLLAGVGHATTTTGFGDVWRTSTSSVSWTRIAGTGTGTGGQSWTAASANRVNRMVVYGNNLYVGHGNNTNMSRVWHCSNYATCSNTSGWTLIAGNGTTGNWEALSAIIVRSLTVASDGTLYAGLGNTTNSNRLFRYSGIGAAWTQIGGGGTAASGQSWAHVANSQVQDLTVNGSTIYAGLSRSNNGANAELWSCDDESDACTTTSGWSRVAGGYVNKSWGGHNLHSVESLASHGGNLYAGLGFNANGNALVWEYDGDDWQIIGGQGVNSSWGFNEVRATTDLVSFKGSLIAGLGLGMSGSGTNMARVYAYSAGSWTQIGGGGSGAAGQSWAYAANQSVFNLAVHQDKLYVGVGSTVNGVGQVWECTWPCTTTTGWVRLSTGWPSLKAVQSLVSYQDQLIAGTGHSTNNEARVYAYNGTTWSLIGGGGSGASGQSWSLTGTQPQTVHALAVYKNKLYAGLGGTTAGHAQIWECSWPCTTTTGWSLVGGNGVTASTWPGGTYTRVRAMAVYNGDLFAALGSGTNLGEIWRWNGVTWSQIASNTVSGTFPANIEAANAFAVYDGKLYTGLGETANIDAQVWSYGNNRVLRSTANIFTANWHHLAAIYNGSNMSIYVNGVLDTTLNGTVTLGGSSKDLLVGSTYGSVEAGLPQGNFQGMLDEVRISNTARSSSSLITSTYSKQPQTVQPSSPVYTSQIKSFNDFLDISTPSGGNLNYRISQNGGTTWLYHNGTSWVASANTSQVNTLAQTNAYLSQLTPTSGGFLWQAVLESPTGEQQVTLSQVTLGATADTDAPSTPTNIDIYTSSAKTTEIDPATWSNTTQPYFEWTASTDPDDPVGSSSGVGGYCVYLGTDNTADPQLAKGILGTSPASNAGISCPFIVTSANLDTSLSNYLGSALVSGSTYYLRLRSFDNAFNYSGISTAVQYQFDNTEPSAPSSVTVSPSGYSATNDFTFSWPAVTVSGSGLAGYQYKTGASTGPLSEWSATTTSTSINIPEAAYQTDSNLFYVRTVDNAGNISSVPREATYFFGGEGPSAPQFLSATPTTNTTNSFSFAWQAPETHSGLASDLTYCYTVNAVPSLANCTYTSAGATSLSAGPFATQIGINTFYVAAKNPATAGGAINYGAYTSVSFVANTSAPGVPLNLDVGDISIKSTETWRIALTWNAPNDNGSATVSRYKIWRSAAGGEYEEIATATGTSHVDTDLEQIEYTYKVQACDSVNNCGIFTSEVSETPTGKFTEPAALTSGPAASSVTTKSAIISWTTNRTSDSKVQFGTSPGEYFVSEPSNSLPKTSHSLLLNNLQPGTTYYYKAKWTDEDGNTGLSEEKSFSTEPAPTVSEAKVTDIGLTSGLVNFKVSGAAKIKVYYGDTTAFGGVSEVTTSRVESELTVQLTGLTDGTKYFYKINAFDADGAEYEGTTLDFETLPRPRITDVRVQQVRGTAQPTVLVVWNTNTDVSSIVTFYPQSNRADAKDEINLEPKKQHRVIIRGLQPQTAYELVVKGRDRLGNEGVSDPQTFTTATDTRPPAISGLKIQGSTQRLQNSQEQVAQLVVSWNTDEPATTQVEYGEGTGNTYPVKTQEDTALKSNHLVVISNLTPSKVYHLRAVSKDSAGNIGNSPDNVTITPKETDSALDLVLSNLQQIFGFLGGVSR